MKKIKTLNNWFVANDNGDIAGHDLTQARAEALAEILKAEEPDANWEALGGDTEEEVKEGIK